MEKGGGTSSGEARPASVADVQKIVSEAQKDTERSLENVLKVVSEKLMSLSVERQASFAGHQRMVNKPSDQPVVATLSGQRRKITNVSAISTEPHRQSTASEQSEAPAEPVVNEGEGAAGVSVQGSTSKGSGLYVFHERKSWSELNSSEQVIEKQSSGWSIAEALGFDDLENKLKHNRSLIGLNSPKNMQHNFVERIVRSALFENICGIAILANAMTIGVHANMRVMADSVFCDGTWLYVFLVFNVFFTLEIIARIAVAKRDFFLGSEWRWNLFDLVIVVAGFIEEIIQRSSTSGVCFSGDMGLTAVRIIRVLRLVRMIRAFRSMAIFRDFRVMASSILQCLIPLYWACLLLVVIQWIFGVYFVHFVSDHVQRELSINGTAVLEFKEGEEEKDPIFQLLKHYGSLWQAMYTLFQSVTGGLDWSAAAGVLFDATGSYNPIILYVFYVALTTFAVLNVVTGVFVENAMKVALHDRDLIIQDKLQERASYMRDALLVFKEADTDGSGMVSESEFQNLVSDVRVQAFFSCLELDLVEARRLFRLMDSNGDGQINPQEFVAGCMSLKGSAKTLDIAALLLEVRRISELWSKYMDHLDQQFEQLQEGLHLAQIDPSMSL